MLRESLDRAILGCWEDKLEEQSYSENTATHKSLSNTKLIVTSNARSLYLDSDGSIKLEKY